MKKILFIALLAGLVSFGTYAINTTIDSQNTTEMEKDGDKKKNKSKKGCCSSEEKSKCESSEKKCCGDSKKEDPAKKEVPAK